MSAIAMEEVRALLGIFVRSSWRDLHLRTGAWEIFLARPDGAANPMRAPQPEPVDLGSVDAPHLGLFHPAVAPGARVAATDVVGRLEVLGDVEDVIAGQAGVVTAVLVEDGALAEYGTPLVRLAA